MQPAGRGAAAGRARVGGRRPPGTQAPLALTCRLACHLMAETSQLCSLRKCHLRTETGSCPAGTPATPAPHFLADSLLETRDPGRPQTRTPPAPSRRLGNARVLSQPKATSLFSKGGRAGSRSPWAQARSQGKTRDLARDLHLSARMSHVVDLGASPRTTAPEPGPRPPKCCQRPGL